MIFLKLPTLKPFVYAGFRVEKKKVEKNQKKFEKSVDILNGL